MQRHARGAFTGSSAAAVRRCRWAPQLLTLLLCALLATSCGDDDETYRTENCVVAHGVTGATYTLCCRLRCAATFDHDDFAEQCTEERSCTDAAGQACPLSVVQQVATPPCF
jgi:hypothetical protein